MWHARTQARPYDTHGINTQCGKQKQLIWQQQQQKGGFPVKFVIRSAVISRKGVLSDDSFVCRFPLHSHISLQIFLFLVIFLLWFVALHPFLLFSLLPSFIVWRLSFHTVLPLFLSSPRSLLTLLPCTFFLCSPPPTSIIFPSSAPLGRDREKIYNKPWLRRHAV